MNSLNDLSKKELIEQLLTLLESKENNACSCHIINPEKDRILLWKLEKDNQITYILRIGIQRFISYSLSDKNNELYWRFRNFYEDRLENKELDNVTKFQQRQNQATNHESTINDNSPADKTISN